MGIVNFFQIMASHFEKATSSSSPYSCDHLCIDMNNLLYGPKFSSHQQMLDYVGHILNRIISTSRPRESVFIALDGSAPIAKLLSQRQRRQRGFVDLVKKTFENSPPGAFTWTPISPDQVISLQFTPGTLFSEKINAFLAMYVAQKSLDPRFSHLSFFFSGTDAPGEGEFKIIQHIVELEEKVFSKTNDLFKQIKETRRNPVKNKAKQLFHIISGDSDMILFGLLQIIKYPAFEFFIRRKLNSEKFIYYHVNSIKDILMSKLAIHSSFTSSCILDFTLLSILSGNDFFPKLSSYVFATALDRYILFRRGSPESCLLSRVEKAADNQIHFGRHQTIHPDTTHSPQLFSASREDLLDWILDVSKITKKQQQQQLSENSTVFKLDVEFFKKIVEPCLSLENNEKSPPFIPYHHSDLPYFSLAANFRLMIDLLSRAIQSNQLHPRSAFEYACDQHIPALTYEFTDQGRVDAPENPLEPFLTTLKINNEAEINVFGNSKSDCARKASLAGLEKLRTSTLREGGDEEEEIEHEFPDIYLDFPNYTTEKKARVDSYMQMVAWTLDYLDGKCFDFAAKYGFSNPPSSNNIINYLPVPELVFTSPPSRSPPLASTVAGMIMLPESALNLINDQDLVSKLKVQLPEAFCGKETRNWGTLPDLYYSRISALLSNSAVDLDPFEPTLLFINSTCPRPSSISTYFLLQNKPILPNFAFSPIHQRKRFGFDGDNSDASFYMTRQLGHLFCFEHHPPFVSRQDPILQTHRPFFSIMSHRYMRKLR